MRGLGLPKPEYNILTGRRIKRRKPFKMSTKKKEWNKAAGRDADDFKTTSKCHNPKCRKRLVWGKKGFNFDHKDNNSSNNSQGNCYLVCCDCHDKHTVIKKKKVRNLITGNVVGHKTYKKKVGYKKKPKKTTKKKTKKKKTNIFGMPIVRMPKIRF